MRKRCLAVVAVLLSGCSLIPRNVPVTAASLVDGDERRVALSVPTCNADHAVEVDETPSEVTIAVTARNDTTDDCQDALTIELSSPLAGRLLIDAGSGDEIVVDNGR
jgi:hypothetical protein